MGIWAQEQGMTSEVNSKMVDDTMLGLKKAGGGAGGGGGGGLAGDIGIFFGDDGSTNVIQYVTIGTLGNSTDFGDLVQGREAAAGASNSENDRGVLANFQGTSTIEYITISILGNATNFGDLLATAEWLGRSCYSNGTTDRAVWAGGSLYKNDMDYVTVSTLGDSVDFGNLTVGRHFAGGASNGESDRGVMCGGKATGAVNVNTIDYVTISTTGNATDLADCSMVRSLTSALSNGSNDREVTGGGHSNPSSGNMDYKTISTGANAVSFGSLIAAKEFPAACSSGLNERGLFAGGGGSALAIDYITISTPANSEDFGDLAVAGLNFGAFSNANT